MSVVFLLLKETISHGSDGSLLVVQFTRGFKTRSLSFLKEVVEYNSVSLNSDT